MSALSPHQIFSDYARLIGIGGIAMAGIIGIIKSWPIIMQAVGLAAREFKGSAESSNGKTVRWQTDLSMKSVVAYMVLALIVVFLFFWLGAVSYTHLTLPTTSRV